jgi:hypothetical protein
MHSLGIGYIKAYLNDNFKTDPEEVFAFDTLQRNHNVLYKKRAYRYGSQSKTP